MPRASGSQPPVSTSENRRSIHSRLVRHAVAGDAGRVLDDGLAAAEDAVHERGLADVRPADDRDDRQRGEYTMPSSPSVDAGEQLGVLVVQVVVVEPARRVAARCSASSSSSRPSFSARRSAPPSYSSLSSAHARSPRCLCVDARVDDAEHGIHGLFEVEVGRIDHRHPWCGGEEVDDRAVRRIAVVQGGGDRCGILRRRASALRRAARTSGAAVSRIRTGASGATTVVMSRPSTTTPGDRMPRRARGRVVHRHAHRGHARDAADGIGHPRLADRVRDVDRPTRTQCASGSSQMRVVEVARRHRAPRSSRRCRRRARARARPARGTRRRCRGSRSRGDGRPA